MSTLKPLTRYNPFSVLDQLQAQLNYLNPRLSSEDESTIETATWFPACDIQETATDFIIHADLPGVNIKDIKISIENNLLTIQGERHHESKEVGKNFSRIERNHGSFYRKFNLPNTIDNSQIQATSKQGVLEIKVPKKAGAQPRTIAIEEL